MAASLFPTVLTQTLGAGDNGTTIALALGKTTIVLVTLTSSIGINGITAAGGNVDGMVVTLQNITGSLALTFAHETGSPSSSRFSNAGLGTVGGGTAYGSVTYRYFGTQTRWIQLGKT